MIIRHPRYKPETTSDAAQATLPTERTSDALEVQLDGSADDALFAADVTPLVLAAQRNQFEIVKLLFSMGESIQEPHSYYCRCTKCRGAESFDELRFAKTRLNIFKGLASEAYISIISPDPFISAFELAHTLRGNAKIEKYFKADYKKLAKQLSDYTLKLMDKVRDGVELDVVLNEAYGTPYSDLDKMARLKLAIRYQEKLVSISHQIPGETGQYSHWVVIQIRG